MADESEVPREDVNLSDISTLAAVIGNMRRVQNEMDDFARQFIEVSLAMRPTFDALEQLIVQAGVHAEAFVNRFRQNLPSNWPRDSKLNSTWRVIHDDGIPIVYVPRSEVVRAILDADDYESRVGVLVENRGNIVDDCRATMDGGALHPAVVDLGDLIHEALTLLGDGHFAGAQSLAVNICDTIVHRTMEPKSRYPKIVKTIQESHFDDELLSVALSFKPVLSFYTTWWPGDPPPPPIRLSRHRTAHGITPDHTSEENATVAVMLATSLAVAVTDWYNWLDAKDVA